MNLIVNLSFADHVRTCSKVAVTIIFLLCLFSFGPGVQNALSSPTNMGMPSLNNGSHVTNNQASNSQTNSNSTQATPKCCESRSRKNKMGIPDRNRINPPKGKKNSTGGTKKKKRKSKKNTTNKKNKKRKIKLLSDSSQTNLITKKIGSAPLLKYYIDRMGVVSIIDSIVEKHPLRKISHGEAVAGLLAYLLNDGRALYQMEKWADESAILDYFFPEYNSHDWTDDRLADSLDGLYEAGLEKIQGAISASIVSEFSIALSEIHYDTTSISFWGTYDSETKKPAIIITFGHSKDYRPDLKQVVLGAAVSGDGGVPLISETHDGNTSDSVLPIPYWERLRNLSQTDDFCLIGDCKVASLKTIKDICSGEGKFLAPLPMTSKEKKELKEKLINKSLKFRELDIEIEDDLLPIYEHEKEAKTTKQKEKEKNRYKVSELYWDVTDNNGKIHAIRKLVIHGSRLENFKKSTRERHLQKTEELLNELNRKLNKRDLRNRKEIQKRVDKILGKYNTKEMIEVKIKGNVEIVKKQIGRGRPGPKTKYKEEKKTIYELKVNRNENVINEMSILDGIFIMVSNQSKERWSSEKLLSLYKRQYKVEKNFSVLKGPLSVTPMLLEKSNRICSMLFIMTLALQLYTLIQREASNELLKRREYLEGVMPNNIKTCRPKTDKILSLFENIMLIEIKKSEEKEIRGITSLNNIQLKILDILNVPKEVYTIEYYYKLPVNT
jgi:transposase